jgi:GTP-binding protein Era
MNLEKRKIGYITLYGPANAGKSTLANKLLGKKVSIVSPKPQTTRRRIIGVRTTDSSQLILIDAPGFFKKTDRGEFFKFLSQEIIQGLESADVKILMLDVTKVLSLKTEDQELTEESVYNYLDKQTFLNTAYTPDIIVLNKIDNINQRDLLSVIGILSTKIFPSVTSYIPISAKSGEGIQTLVKEIEGKLEFGELLYPEDYITEESDLQFAAELVREKAFMLLSQELPYSLATNCIEWTEEKGLNKIMVDILVEKDSHKGIVIGQGGSMLKKIGEQARLELEKIYGEKVFLKLFVKVEENWTLTKQGIQKIGLSI